MPTDNVFKFPSSGSQRRRNQMGKRAAPCLVTERWLQFGEGASQLPGGRYLFIDVMTMGADEQPRKLTTLCLSKEDILQALDNVEDRA